MTVCVAAICRGLYADTAYCVIGAADRMITASDIQYEPAQPKIIKVNTRITIMTAGDSTQQTEIIQDVIAEVSERMKANPNLKVSIRDAAYIYSRNYELLRFRHAERNILAPLGLDGDTFIARQKEMSPEFITDTISKLQSFQFEGGSEAIVAGLDDTGPHIYRLVDSVPRCHDQVGFAAIGGGAWHAESQFMFAGYTKEWLFADASYLLYTAKKRAEVAPGVGTQTDMVLIQPNGEPQYANQPDGFIKNHELVYQHIQENLGKLIEIGKELLRKVANEIHEAKIKKEQESEGDNAAGSEAANESDIRGGSNEGEQKSGDGESAPT